MTETLHQRRPMMEYMMPSGAGYSDTRRKAKNAALILGIISLLMAGVYGFILMVSDVPLRKMGLSAEEISFVSMLLLGATAICAIWGFLYITGSIMINGFSKAWPIVMIVIGTIHALSTGYGLFVLITTKPYVVAMCISGAVFLLELQLIIKCAGVCAEDARR